MTARHFVHDTTRQAVIAGQQEGESLMAFALRLGDKRYKPALSSIINEKRDVGRMTERKIRVALGMAVRELTDSDLRRHRLRKACQARGLTLEAAAEAWLAMLDSSGKGDQE
tara:strand:- start:442 stop:777 length:336 start_codon:yes stop_codon:yes gene_type:complete